MFEELLALKAEAEKEILYAQAKIEVADRLLAKYQPAVEPSVDEEVAEEYVEATDSEMEGL